MFIDQKAGCCELTTPCSEHVVNGEKLTKLTTVDDRVAVGEGETLSARLRWVR